MPLGVWQATITDRKGNILPNASIEVREETTGNLANIFSDRDGLNAITQPGFQPDADGLARFYAAGSITYKITVTDAEKTTVHRYVPTGTLAEYDYGDDIQFNDLTLTGQVLSDIDLAGAYKILNMAAPANPTDAVTKQYVDGLFGGLDWQESVIDEQNAPPGTPSTGDRYLVGTAPSGSWVGHANEIAEWDGSAWVFYPPDENWVVTRESDGRVRIYQSGSWVNFGSTVYHNAAPDLQGGVSGEYYHFTAQQHTDILNHYPSTANPHNVTKAQVGLGLVANHTLEFRKDGGARRNAEWDFNTSTAELVITTS